MIAHNFKEVKMANRSEQRSSWNAKSVGVTKDQGIDLGLRSYMIQVYNFMALALAITGGVSYAVASSPALMATLFGTGLKWLVIFAPLGIVMLLSFGIAKMSYSTARLVFMAYSVAMGLSMSMIFMIFTQSSIARVFFITASVFGAMSLYGYTTRRDLSGFGSFLFMGLIGLVIASIVNMFLHSTGLQMVLSYVGVLIFTGLTAYDTQMIRSMYYERDSEESTNKKALMGALALYLDFINLFYSLLHILGDRR